MGAGTSLGLYPESKASTLRSRSPWGLPFPAAWDCGQCAGNRVGPGGLLGAQGHPRNILSLELVWK